MHISEMNQKWVIISILLSGIIPITLLYLSGLAWSLWLLAIWVGIILPLTFKKFEIFAGLIALRIGIPIVISLIIWVMFRHVVQSQFLGSYSRQLYSDWSTITVALGIFATLHALVFAFSLWKAMNDFDSLKNCLRDEANKILSISALLRFFDNVDTKKSKRALMALRECLSEYVDNIIQNVGKNTESRNEKLLNKCIDQAEFLEVEQTNDEIALHGVINGFSELIMIRSHRISCMRNRMSPFLFLIIAVMSISVIAMFFVRNPTGFNSNEFIIPVISFVYSYLLVMLIDLDRPFDGFWKVSINVFKNVKMETRK